MKTLPIVLGLDKTSKLASILGLMPTAFLVVYINNYFVIIYCNYNLCLRFVVGPLLFSVLKFGQPKQKEFHKLSLLLKWILFGINIHCHHYSKYKIQCLKIN
jgi:4-hydroxybenzoate polyprenyltransferase